MGVEMRKARVKILKRLLNSLTVEIGELKARGMDDTEDLDLARNAITRYCNKLWPLSLDSARSRPARHGAREDHGHLIRRAAA
jgi:hypothetical protein